MKINLWLFVHTHNLYIYQRANIMIWLNSINELSAKTIKSFNFKFNFIDLYRHNLIYIFWLIIILILI